MTAETPPNDGLSFEEAFARLEATVQRLEVGDLSLEEALGLFEEGMRLVQQCLARLDAAELRVSQIIGSPEQGYALIPYPDRTDA